MSHNPPHTQRSSGIPAVQVRLATVEDANALQPLMAELGYPADKTSLRNNLLHLASGPRDRAWVAESSDGVIGVVSVHVIPLFHTAGALGRVTSLVVAAPARRAGVGSSLMAQAEAFCKELGCERIELTSGDHRLDARHFYQQLGYSIHSRRFIKYLSSAK